MSDLFSWASGNLLWQVLEWYVIALVATSPLYGVFKYAFDALQKKKQVIAFWLSVPLVILMFVVTLRTLVVPAPNLVPNLEMLAYGGIGSMKVENQNPVAIVDTITNSGNMPSVVTDFHLTATLHGRIYEALRIAMPDIISLSDKNNSGTVRYLGTDALYERGTHAISPGGLVAGVLLFNFSNLSAGSIETEKPDMTLTFRDAQGHAYTQPIHIGSEPSNTQQVIPGIIQQIVPPAANVPASPPK